MSVSSIQKTVQIYHDPDPMNPREWDNLGTLVCCHSRYSFGDVNISKRGMSEEEILEKAGVKKGAIILPVYMFDHSGITLSTAPFSCPWDSGQVGIIFANRDKILKEYQLKILTARAKEKARQQLKSEVHTMDLYVRGACYGYKIINPMSWAGSRGEEESCWGFLGDTLEETGMLNNIDPELHNDLKKAFEKPLYFKGEE